MNIGIMTFHNTLNYGAELQAYALKKSIKIMGYSACLIDYQCNAVNRREAVKWPSMRHILRHPVNSFRETVDLPKRKTRKEKFANFAALRLDLDASIHSQNSLTKYDAVVVGSDQVWNLSCTGGDKTYFLGDIPHGEVKKVSYAASFGGASMPARMTSDLGKAIQDFDAISVREASGVEIVKRLSGRDAVQVLDPTLLLAGEEWRNMCGSSHGEGGYVFAYVVSERRNTLRFAREVSDEMGLPLVIIDCYGAPRLSERGLYINDASPEEFLALIRDAALVITSSFHGLALSLAMGSEVRYSLDTKRANANSRLEDLARLVGVEDHEVSKGLHCKAINFDTVEEFLEEKREESWRFLSSALGQ